MAVVGQLERVGGGVGRQRRRHARGGRGALAAAPPTATPPTALLTVFDHVPGGVKNNSFLVLIAVLSPDTPVNYL